MQTLFVLRSAVFFFVLLVSLIGVSFITYQCVRRQQPRTFLSLLGDLSFALFLLMVPLYELQEIGWFSLKWRHIIKLLYHMSMLLFFGIAMPFSGYMPAGRKRLQHSMSRAPIRRTKQYAPIWILRHKVCARMFKKLLVPLVAFWILWIQLQCYVGAYASSFTGMAWILSPLAIKFSWILTGTLVLFLLALFGSMFYISSHYPTLDETLIQQLEAERHIEALTILVMHGQFAFSTRSDFSSQASLALQRLLQTLPASDFAELPASTQNVLLELLRRSRQEALLLTLLSRIEQTQGIWAKRAVHSLAQRSPLPNVRRAAQTCLKQLIACEQPAPQTLLRSSQPETGEQHLLHPAQSAIASSLQDAKPLELVRGCAQEGSDDMASKR